MRLISSGFSGSPEGDPADGDGERTTDGMRECPNFKLSGALFSLVLEVIFVVIVEFGSQLYPGLIIKLTVSPSLILYSFRSLESARALPLRRRRWTSAGGARG